jgi:hypothetical protein
MDDWWWAQKSLLAPVRFLRYCGVQAHHGRHRDVARWVMRDVRADDAPDLRVRVVVRVVCAIYAILVFAFAKGSLSGNKIAYMRVNHN